MNTSKDDTYNPIIILGSSRGDGNTLKAVKMVFPDETSPLIDLSNLNISYYDYHNKNSHDDFLPFAEKMINHNPIILATPVYWYTMSAIMKTFIDRWSDLISIRKDIGRKMKGKDLYIITSFGSNIPKGFEDAFSQTCDYMEMNYKGCYYYHSDAKGEDQKENVARARQFISLMKAVK